MKHLILGTAGHIDHGKTSLVKALTGIDTDRLKEEKARGITIELGFAHLEINDAVRFGIVDVPGHERFIRTMVAGVGGMDLVMLVIAADDGIMPQTREHLAICQLLGVKTGLVALTKADLVDRDWLGLVAEEIREFLSGTFLDCAPVIPVSSQTGEGLPELLQALAALAASVEQKRSDGPFRLPVDRVFTVAGFGTVVTGTLLSGHISVGDEVEILPNGVSSRVRSIQTHNRSSQRGDAGQRLAVNLQGVEQEQVQRGDVVAPAAIYTPTRTVDVRIDYLSSAAKPLKHRATVRLHAMTFEVPSTVILFDRQELLPGESSYAQLRLTRPALLLPGDPFILRTHSPQATIGGGILLDPAPPRRRRRSAMAMELLASIEKGDETEILVSLIESSLLSGISFEELLSRTGFAAKKIDSALAPLLAQAVIVQVVRTPRIFLSRAALTELKGFLVAETGEYLAKNPLREGIGKEELKTRMPKRSDQRFFTPLLASLEKEGLLRSERELVTPAGAGKPVPQLTAGVQTQLLELVTAGGKEPPTLRELSEQLRIEDKQLLDHLTPLVRNSTLVKVKGDLFYCRQVMDELRRQLTLFLQEKKEITPQQFRELTGLSRKFMIPVLEYFDAEKVTIRVGDKRLLRRG